MDKSPYDIPATRAMFDLKTDSFELVLSERARKFISDNALGEFGFRFDDEDGLIVRAPNAEAAYLFRMAF